MDLLLTDEHDIAFVNGVALVTEDLKQSTAQRLKVKLSTFKGEWFADANTGIDYFGSVFGKRRRKETVDLIMQTAILEDPDVIRIVSFSSGITANRAYEMTFSAQVTDGTVASVTVNVGV